MLHALRSHSPKARAERDAGFTLIEILVAMVLMTIVMSSLAVFFIGAQKSSSALRVRENAAVVADQAMDKVHSIQATKILTGRDKTSSDTQWASPVTGVDLTGMNEVWDTTATSGSGTSASTAILPTVPQPVVANKTTYNVSTYVGTCWILMGGGNCVQTKPSTTAPVQMDRIIIAVNWADKGNGCPGHICAYVIGSLVSPLGDPTFNVNQVVIDTTPPSTPTLGTCNAASGAAGDQAINLGAWSPSTDASGVARYDIYEGLSADFSSMTKDGTMTGTGPYTDTGLVPNTTYYFVVVALDTVGNQSGPQLPNGTVSNPQQPFMASCATVPDTFAPTTAPTIAAGAAATTSTTNFTWAAVTDDYKMGGYQVFRNGTYLQTVAASATSYTDTGLSPYVTYQYTVKAVDSFGNVSGASNTLNIQTKDTVAPTTPAALTATPQPWPALEIDLNWNDSTDDVAVTGYTVWRSLTGSSGWTAIGAPTASSWADTSGLAGNTKYYYYVTAHDAVPNTSTSSTVVNASTPDTIPPSAPTNLTAPSKTPTTITLTWTASTDNVGVAGYNIYRNGGTTPINGSAVTGTTFTDSGLTQLTSYTYTVKAYDAAGNVSAASTALVVSTTDGLPPSAPVVSNSAKTFTTVTLNWTTSTDNVAVTGYAVYRNGVLVMNIAGNSTFTYTDSGLTPNTTYTYTVKAYDAAGNYSVASNSLPVTTVQDTTAPSTVTKPTGSTAGKNSATISWAAATDNVAVASYQIYVGGALNQTVTSPTLSYFYASPAFLNSSIYSITVYAIDTSGNKSLVSPTLTVTVSSSGNVTFS
ncbi:hypothetical protein acdb102_35220 [Acidothermaceae bacterium B102]|nr:hypothetical protein acdb102_35220 [Acidothermaceae bacterium B102]